MDASRRLPDHSFFDKSPLETPEVLCENSLSLDPRCRRSCTTSNANYAYRARDAILKGKEHGSRLPRESVSKVVLNKLMTGKLLTENSNSNLPVINFPVSTAPMRTVGRVMID